MYKNSVSVMESINSGLHMRSLSVRNPVPFVPKRDDGVRSPQGSLRRSLGLAGQTYSHISVDLPTHLCSNVLMRVSVLLTDEEYGIIKGKAGQVPLSRWFRDLGLGTRDARGSRVPSVRKVAEVPTSEGREPVAGGASKPARSMVSGVEGTAKQAITAECKCGHGSEEHWHGRSCQHKLCMCRGFE